VELLSQVSNKKLNAGSEIQRCKYHRHKQQTKSNVCTSLAETDENSAAFKLVGTLSTKTHALYGPLQNEEAVLTVW